MIATESLLRSFLDALILNPLTPETAELKYLSHTTMQYSSLTLFRKQNGAALEPHVSMRYDAMITAH